MKPKCYTNYNAILCVLLLSIVLFFSGFTSFFHNHDIGDVETNECIAHFVEKNWRTNLDLKKSPTLTPIRPIEQRLVDNSDVLPSLTTFDSYYNKAPPAAFL